MTHFKILLASVAAAALTACQPSLENAKSASVETDDDSWCITGGPIYTAVDDAPKATAIAVTDGIISNVAFEVVSEGWCSDNAPENASNINLDGKALYPGLTDAHGHLLGIGLREMTLDMTGALSLPEMQARLKSAIESAPEGETIYGAGWIETHWPEKRFPTRADLDAIAPHQIVMLSRADGHAMVINSAALEAAGITKDTEVPFGGDILKDANGEPTGMLIDNAMSLVDSLFPKLTPELRKEAFIRASDVYTSRGWTNIHSMSVDTDSLPVLKDLEKSGDLGLRVYNSPDVSRVDEISVITGFEPSNHISARAIKLYSDGALGSRGAALLAPYDDDPGNMGLLLITKERIMPILTEALKKGVQVNTHAIGDRANQLLLDWYEEAFKMVPPAERAIAEPRWRVEHAQILTLDDIKRFQALGVIPSMQPSHAIGDLYFAVDRIGPERLKGGYAWRSLIDSGSIIAGGSDAPVEVGDPRIEFYAAVTRKSLDGYNDENWYPEEKVTRQEALKMFTIWPAYAAFEEDKLGSIEVGKAADFSVFNTDIMTAAPEDILTANVAMTIVDGKVVYAAPK